VLGERPGEGNGPGTGCLAIPRCAGGDGEPRFEVALRSVTTGSRGQAFPLIRATRLEELYRGLGWTEEEPSACDRSLADFIFRGLGGSAYAALGYASVQDVLDGDILLIRRLSSTPGSGIHLYVIPEQHRIRAFGLWYSLRSGGLDLLPPDYRTEDILIDGCGRGEIAYGDWLIVEPASRVRGLGLALFAMLLDDMAEAGYRRWYGRTVVPENQALYERLYRGKGRASLLGQWQDGPLTRIGFLGSLEGGWTRALVKERLPSDGNC
jgi:hypothetical protein